MDAVQFSMVGEPRGKGRPRVFVQGGRSVATTDPATRKYEASITALARLAMGNKPPLTGPLSVSLRFRMPIPASASKRAKAAMAAGEVAPTSRPDLDNLAKAVLDGIAEDAALKRKIAKDEALKAAGADARVMFRNDSQIARLFLTKIYSESPGVDVRVEPLAPQEAA